MTEQTSLDPDAIDSITLSATIEDYHGPRNRQVTIDLSDLVHGDEHVQWNYDSVLNLEDGAYLTLLFFPTDLND